MIKQHKSVKLNEDAAPEQILEDIKTLFHSLLITAECYDNNMTLEKLTIDDVGVLTAHYEVDESKLDRSIFDKEADESNRMLKTYSSVKEYIADRNDYGYPMIEYSSIEDVATDDNDYSAMAEYSNIEYYRHLREAYANENFVFFDSELDEAIELAEKQAEDNANAGPNYTRKSFKK